MQPHGVDILLVEDNANDAELTLRKARARAEKLGDVERERERTERELLRLQALTSETRARLSALITEALDTLGGDGKAEQGDGSKPALGDLEETLRHEVGVGLPVMGYAAREHGPTRRLGA